MRAGCATGAVVLVLRAAAGAGTGLAPVHRGRAHVGLPSPEAALRRADLPWLAAVILFRGGLGPLFLMLGLRMTSAATGSLLLNLEGLATMAIAWVAFRENVDPQADGRGRGDTGRGGGAVLDRAGPAAGCRGGVDRTGLSGLGHRQRPDAKAVGGRSGADRDDQGPCRGQREHSARAWVRCHLARRCRGRGGGGPGGFWVWGSALCCSCWACGIWVRRGRVPVSRWHRSSVRRWPCRCSAKRSACRWPWRAC